MPANLPPEYYEIDKRYRDAKSTAEKIQCLEDLLSVIPKHKGTDKLRADIRKRLSKHKSSPKSKKASRQESLYLISKEGGAQIVVLGAPNVGKSTLVSAVTNAPVEISPAPHTTWKPLPGMMSFKGIQIQLIDTPPINPDFMESDYFDMVKRADLVLLMVDLTADPFQQLEECLKILQDHKIVPIYYKEKYLDNHRMTILPFIVVLNKNDDETSDEDVQIFFELIEERWNMVAVSAETGRNLEEVKKLIFERLKLIRVFSKIPGKEADMTAPFVLRQGDTVEVFAAKVHHDFARNLKTARIWGRSVYDGQMVQRDHILEDEDIVELHI